LAEQPPVPRCLRDGYVVVDVGEDGEPGPAEVVMALPADAQFIICMALSVPLIMPDNAVGRCAACNGPIQFRPHVPAALAKVCYACAPAWVEGQGNPQ